MLKRVGKFFVLLLVFALMASVLVACGSGDYKGTYYAYKNGVKQENDWIKLEKDKWSDNEGASGRLEEKDGVLYGYVVFFGEEDVMFTGTAKDGIFEFSFEGADYISYYTDKCKAENKNSSIHSKTNDGKGEGATPSTTTYAVTFNPNGGSFTSTGNYVIRVNSGETMEEPRSPQRNDYNFAGWARNQDGSGKWNFVTDKVTGDVTLFAVWTKENLEYAVRFVLNYSGADEVTKMTEDGYITYVPKRDGYDFNGWYTDSALNKKWNMETKVTVSGLVLYADWAEEITEEGQLRSPSVSIDDGVFSWDPISRATGYRVIVSLNGENLFDENTPGTRWSFPRYQLPTQAGVYNYSVKIRANGDGVTTTNSTYTNKTWTYKLRVLDPLLELKFDKQTQIISWLPVENAEQYRIDRSEYGYHTTIGTTTETSFDMSEFDAGTYSITVYAQKENWMDAKASVNFTKQKLKMPKVDIDFNISNENYYISWDYSEYANIYILTFGEKQIRQEERTYTIPKNSTLWNGTEKIDFTVCAFDEKGDYLISPSLTYSIEKYYKVSVKRSPESEIAYIKSNKTEATLEFDMNGVVPKKNVEEQVITNENSIVYPPIPTAEKYLFTGWYTTRDCTTLFDFSKDIALDTKVYAGWYKEDEIISVDTPSNYKENDLAVLTASCKYFAILKSGTFTVRYRNYSNGNIYLINIYLYDVTDNEKLIASVSDCNSTSARTFTFAGKAGHVYKLMGEKNTYGSTVYLSVYGDNSVVATGKLSDRITGSTFVSASGLSSLTFVAETQNPDRYYFDGWYDGSLKISEDYETSYSFSESSSARSLTAKWGRYTISTDTNDPDAGKYTYYNKYTYTKGTEITLTATPKLGYEFLGWYVGDTKVSNDEDLTYTFKQIQENETTFTAKWELKVEMKSFEFTSTETTCEIKKVKETATKIIIPDYVTSIATDAFRNSNSLTSITIFAQITSIGNSAFRGCSSLTSITIPDSVTSIESYAFEDCGSLTSITLPDSVTSIGYKAFSDCSSLTNVYYTGDIASWCGITFNNDNYSYDSNPLRYAHNLYIDNELIKEIVIPDTVTEIKAYAFHGWNGTSITLPDSVTSIGDYAFYNCSNLTSITIPDSVTSIGERAFENCSSLTSVYYTGDIASWCGITFSGYYSNPLRYAHNLYINNEIISGEIVLPNTVTQIPDYTFRNSNITSIIIPDSVTSIGSYAFYECSNLTSVYYTGDIASWCGITFSGYSSNPLIYVHNLYIDNELIKDIVIPDTVTEIKAYAFHGWNGTSITIPDSVTSIGEEAFSYCSSLQYNEYDNGYYLGNDNNPYLWLIKVKNTSITSCTIHEDTKFIYRGVFYYCSSLTSITLGNSVTSIGNSAFNNCSSLTSVHYKGDIASWCGITFDYYSNPLEYAHNLYIDNELIKDIIIPDTVTEIKARAFYGWNGTSITLPTGVTSIGEYAFSWCSSLTSITIPDGITSIGVEAFSHCSSLTSITIPDSVTSIGNSAFRDCSRLTSITIPDSVTSIGSYAFFGCTGLTSITIPDSVTSIGEGAFSSCSSLTSITFQGTKAQWNAIRKSYKWNVNTGSYTVHCTDGDISK